MTDIQPRTTEYQVPDDPSWLGSAHGLDATDTITLDAAAFDPETAYPDGYIPGGTPLAEITATGLYGPYTTANTTTGLGVLAGHLVTSKAVKAADAKIVAAILTHGKVREANLFLPVDAAGKADVAGRIQYV